MGGPIGIYVTVLLDLSYMLVEVIDILSIGESIESLRSNQKLEDSVLSYSPKALVTHTFPSERDVCYVQKKDVEMTDVLLGNTNEYTVSTSL